jgi:uncharacterized membrane protein YjjP (DUF1212 family)
LNRNTVVNVLAFVVSGVWAAVALSSVLTQDYTALSIVTPVMLIVAGFLFGRKVIPLSDDEGDDGGWREGK